MKNAFDTGEGGPIDGVSDLEERALSGGAGVCDLAEGVCALENGSDNLLPGLPGIFNPEIWRFGVCALFTIEPSSLPDKCLTRSLHTHAATKATAAAAAEALFRC
jgi:hypothetical protein